MLFQKMGRYGKVVNEHVGSYDAKHGTTPVTVQIILSAKEYEKVKKYTSKNPHYLIDDPKGTIPKSVNKFIKAYLDTQREALNKEEEMEIDASTVRISANELPAIQVNQAINIDEEIFYALLGDASLGLSYFKGLNAGLEALAKFLTMMQSTLENAFDDEEEIQRALENYQAWFEVFSDKKIKEVKDYSKKKVRPGIHLFKFLQKVNGTTHHAPDDLNEYTTRLSLLNKNPYPHRSYNPEIFFAQWNYIPLRWTLKKIGKFFIDYFKPYKNTYQVKRDFFEPFSSISVLLLGIARFLLGIVTFSPKRIGDGFLRLVLGALQFFSTPFTWTIKPILRLLITIFSKRKRVEENHGFRKLVELGEEKLNNYSENSDSDYELLGVCFDLHRKFEKSKKRGQKSKIDKDLEVDTIYNLASSDTLNKGAFLEYFSLFSSPQKEMLVAESSSLELASI